MEYRIQEWNSSTGAYIRDIGFLKSVQYKAQCNEASDLRFGALLNEMLTVEIFNSAETKLTEGAWVSFEIKNNPVADADSRTAGWTDTEYTFYGIYKIDKILTGKGFYTFVAYSATHDLNVDYSERLKYLDSQGMFPMTMLALVQDACSYIGMGFEMGDYPSDFMWQRQQKAFYATGITVKDILCAAAELKGGYVRDYFGYANTTPTSPVSTQRKIVFQNYTLRENKKSDNSTGYYLIAPTDAAVDTSAFTGTLFSNVYYKENGFAAGDAINPVTRMYIVDAEGNDSTVSQIPEPLPRNIYYITNNIMFNNTFLQVGNLSPWTLLQEALGSPIYHPTTVKLFPFFCPFRCGDKANITDGNGTSFQMPIMSFEINDFEAILSCTGNALYETAQNQYSTADEYAQSNSVEINKLRNEVYDVPNFRATLGLPYYELPSGGGTLNFTVTNGTRLLVFVASAGATYKGMWILNTPNTGGTLTKAAVLDATSVSVTMGNNSFSVSMSAAGWVGLLVFGGSVTKT